MLIFFFFFSLRGGVDIAKPEFERIFKEEKGQPIFWNSVQLYG
jgi:hypothetical protein